MKLLDRFRGGRKRINLDVVPNVCGTLVIHESRMGRETPRKTIVLLIRAVLRQILDDGAVAVNLFYDSQDDCLRMLEYSKNAVTPETWEWRELLPVPGYIARQVLDEFEWRTRCRELSTFRLLYSIDRSSRWAYVEWPEPNEVRIFFTDERPPMRTKLTAT